MSSKRYNKLPEKTKELKPEVIEIAVINSKDDFHTLDSKTVSEALKKIK